jgi:hypothetical protein
MRQFLSGLIILASAVPLCGQNIERATPSRDHVVPVHTALDHLTVIEVGEPVVTVAAGSAAFKIEWRDNKVFVEPTEAGVTTNLFIWTATTRLNYELESAGAVEKMDFAIDYPAPVLAPPKSVTPPASGAANADPAAKSNPIDPMVEGRPVHSEFLKSSGHGVDVLVRDLVEQNDTLFIRYEIRNTSADVYVPGVPHVFALSGVRSPVSLIDRHASQLSTEEAKKLNANDQKLLPIVEEKLRSSTVASGAETIGVVAVKLPVSAQKPSVLRIDFSPTGRGRVSATLVL